MKTPLAAVMLISLLSACLNSEPAAKGKDAGGDSVPKTASGAESVPAFTLKEAEALYVKALRETDEGKRTEAFKAARKALLDVAEQGKDSKAHLLLGYMADLGQGMPVDGIQAARHYRIAADSGLTEAKIALAEFWRRNEIFLDEAVKQIKGIPDYEDNPAALCTLGAVYYAMYENEKGFQLLKKVYRSPKATASIRLDVLKILHGMFEKYFKGNNYDAALQELRRTDELEPGNYLTSYLMGLVELRRGNLAEAEKMFNRSWKANPAIPENYRELAFVKVHTGRFDEALDNAKTAYDVSGKKPEFERALLEIYYLTGKIDAMLGFVNARLKENPKRFPLRLIRITIFQKKKEYRKAYDDLKELMKDPAIAKDAAFLESWANVCSMLGQYDEAVKANESILKQGFRPVPALNLAELYIITGRSAQAVELLRHPDFKDRKEPLIGCVVPYLEACALLAQGKAADEPIRQFRAALPEFLAKRKDIGEWDTNMFKNWLKKADIPLTAKESIEEMTAAFDAECVKTKTVSGKPPVKEPGAQRGGRPDEKKSGEKTVPGKNGDRP